MMDAAQAGLVHAAMDKVAHRMSPTYRLYWSKLMARVKAHAEGGVPVDQSIADEINLVATFIDKPAVDPTVSRATTEGTYRVEGEPARGGGSTQFVAQAMLGAVVVACSILS